MHQLLYEYWIRDCVDVHHQSFSFVLAQGQAETLCKRLVDQCGWKTFQAFTKRKHTHDDGACLRIETFINKFFYFQEQNEKKEKEDECRKEKHREIKKKEMEAIKQGKRPFFLKKCKFMFMCFLSD